MQAGRYGRACMILACFILLAYPAWAAQNLEEIAAGIAREMPNRLQAYEDLAQALARQEHRRVAAQAEKLAKSLNLPDQDRILLFITLGEKPLENLEANRRLCQDIREVSPDAVVVLRGLPQGQRTLKDLFMYVRQLTGKEGPRIMLNPLLFRRYNVTVSPTLVYGQNGTAVAWARGIINSQWLKDRVKQGARGDLGQWGETTIVAERDFVEEMQSRLAGIDWEAKKEEAVANYWQKQQFLGLPPASHDRVFYLDAAYKVERDFVLPDGKILARAGQKIDLFKIIPPTFLLVVFDASDPKQLQWAMKIGSKQAGKQRVKYITTRIPDREHGWKSLAQLYETLDAPVFLLNAPVRDRFKLRYVPSTVRFVKAKHKFEVKECAVK
jgi:conjugal transfer pilus assembly protein TraW